MRLTHPHKNTQKGYEQQLITRIVDYIVFLLNLWIFSFCFENLINFPKKKKQVKTGKPQLMISRLFSTPLQHVFAAFLSKSKCVQNKRCKCSEFDAVNVHTYMPSAKSSVGKKPRKKKKEKRETLKTTFCNNVYCVFYQI